MRLCAHHRLSLRSPGYWCCTGKCSDEFKAAWGWAVSLCVWSKYGCRLCGLRKRCKRWGVSTCAARVGVSGCVIWYTVTYTVLSLGMSGDTAVMHIWWNMCRMVKGLGSWSECRLFIVRGIVGWDICTVVDRGDDGLAARTCLTACWVCDDSKRSMVVRSTGEVESWCGFTRASEDVSWCVVRDAVRSHFWLFREGCSCDGGAGAKLWCSAVRRSAKVFWWISAKMTQSAYVEGIPSSVCGEAHAGQLLVDDLVMICRSRAQCSQMWGWLGVETLIIGQGQTVAAWMYHWCCCVSVGSGLAM